MPKAQLKFNPLIEGAACAHIAKVWASSSATVEVVQKTCPYCEDYCTEGCQDPSRTYLRLSAESEVLLEQALKEVEVILKSWYASQGLA